MSIETISACATVLRRVWPHSMSSCHMSEEYANSPVTLRVPSGRSVDSPMLPLACFWVTLVGVAGGNRTGVLSHGQTASDCRAAARRTASRIFS